MAAKIFRVLGLSRLLKGLDNVSEDLEDVSIITKELASSMRKNVHVATGYLRTTIYHKNNVAGAKAPYAGFEARRGGSHDFAQAAIDAFALSKYANYVVKRF
jgi:hypothetical protein